MRVYTLTDAGMLFVIPITGAALERELFFNIVLRAVDEYVCMPWASRSAELAFEQAQRPGPCESFGRI